MMAGLIHKDREMLLSALHLKSDYSGVSYQYNSILFHHVGISVYHCMIATYQIPRQPFLLLDVSNEEVQPLTENASPCVC